MTLRDQWEFGYPVEEILRASRDKLAHHNNRHQYWTAEQQRVLTDLRESGLEVRSHRVSGGTQASIVIDPEKARWLNKVESKLAEHQDYRERYSRWVGVLRVQEQTTRLPLHIEDVIFFGLAEGVDHDE